MSSKDDWVEVSVRYQRWVIDVIDGVALHKRVNRADVLRAIGISYADDKLREHSLIHKVAVRNELTADPHGPSRTDERWHETMPLDPLQDRPPTVEIEKRSRAKKR